MDAVKNLEAICKLIRYDILTSTTKAGSGHPTSSLSAVELMATLFFNGHFHFDFDNPHSIANDRLVFSKGHATPLLYSLYHASGALSYEELMTLRQFDSQLEGHPTSRFKYAEVATGSLGQGLSAGVGYALGLRPTSAGVSQSQSARSGNTDSNRFQPTSTERIPKAFVLLGDSETAEGQVWEAMQLASYYKLNNLIGILDVNRLGQRGATMLEWDLNTYAKRAETFGWTAIKVEDGHNLEKVNKAFTEALTQSSKGGKPIMIIAKTKKGHGVSILENKDDWHGKPLPKDKLEEALKELGDIDKDVCGEVTRPVIHGSSFIGHSNKPSTASHAPSNYKIGDEVATREAYGHALAALGKVYSHIIALDGEVSNSTFADQLKKTTPDQFFEMFIAEQNMVTTAVAMSKLGFIPFVSSFSAFLTRAYDQIRMGQYSDANIKIVGSHAGVSIGEDGPSQMGLEDISMMRSIHGSTVFYPSDAVSCARLTQIAAENEGIYYLRTSRPKSPVLYQNSDDFRIGGSNVLKQSNADQAVVVGAGVTLHEALKAYDELQKEGVNIAVVDLYCVKPVDTETLSKLLEKTKHLIVVEDHYPEGGIGEAVVSALSELGSMNKEIRYTHLAVKKIPRSGKPEELLAYEEIDAQAIVKAVTS